MKGGPTRSREAALVDRFLAIPGNRLHVLDLLRVRCGEAVRGDRYVVAPCPQCGGEFVRDDNAARLARAGGAVCEHGHRFPIQVLDQMLVARMPTIGEGMGVPRPLLVRTDDAA